MYDVDWMDPALEQLAEIWTDAPDRKEVTAASSRIDRQLQRDPFAFSESREGNHRVMFDSPLAIIYEVDAPRRKVNVWAVWRIGPR